MRRLVVRFDDEVLQAGGDPRRIAEVRASRSTEHLGAQGFVQQQLLIGPDQYHDTPVDLERVMALVESEVLGFHEL
jgi:hypothetical protein